MEVAVPSDGQVVEQEGALEEPVPEVLAGGELTVDMGGRTRHIRKNRPGPYDF